MAYEYDSGTNAVAASLNELTAASRADMILQETRGTLTADGTEQILYACDAPLGLNKPICIYVDLDNMQGGDTTIIRWYVRIADGGNLQLLDYTSYTGADGGLANGVKLILLQLQPMRLGVRITLEQSAGVNRTYNWEICEEAVP